MAKIGDAGISRRTLMQAAAAAGVSVAGGSVFSAYGAAPAPDEPPAGWEREPMRWFQLAFTEDDPGQFSPQFWLDYFKEIHAEGVCLSAGGGTAFYPTKVPYHGMARGLDGRDPFGAMVAGCKELGIRVLARIDTHAMSSEVFNAHPEWAQRTADGKPRVHPTAPDLYRTCPYTGYNFELMPKVLEEIASTYPVDGFFGNRVNTAGVCYCDGCKELYRKATGYSIPTELAPNTEEGWRYWNWSEGRIMELIDLWNQTIQRVRPNSFFVPGTERRMVAPYDGKRFGERMPIVFGDRQGRRSTDYREVWDNGRFAKELRAYMFDKPVGNIISVGVEEPYRWKDSVQAGPEIRIWAASAIAQGSRPWITKFNGKPFDRTWMPVISDIYNWHYKNERYLRNTDNLARVGMIMDQRAEALLGGAEGGWVGGYDAQNYRLGFYEALLEARIPFDELDIAYLDPEHLRRFRLLVLPNTTMLSEAQCQTIRDYVKDGGRIVATHETSLYDENGKMRENFGLADLFGCRFTGEIQERVQNSYLTLRHPHPALAGLEDTPRVIGAVKRVVVEPDGPSEPPPLTLVPSYQDLPMERVYTDTPLTDIPMAYCRNVGKGRVVYLPMDIDRTFEEIKHGGHLGIMHAMVDWAYDETQPMTVEGPGLIDIAYWRQENSLAAHLVNYNNPMALAGSYREAIPAGPYRVSILLPEGAAPDSARLLESGKKVKAKRQGDRLIVEVPHIVYHEIVAVDLK